jgi:hypothetical protein
VRITILGGQATKTRTTLSSPITSPNQINLVRTMSEPQSSSANAQGAPETATWDAAGEKIENGTNGTNGPTPASARRPHQSTVSQVSAPVFTQLGNPGPLGLIAFAITTFVVGLLECGAGYVGSIKPPSILIMS